ncbi:hypothetical protein HN873_046194 [Arachis hypogaea]
MESLVFIKYNQQLIERYNLKDEVDPIALNDIDECNEWCAKGRPSGSKASKKGKGKAVIVEKEELEFEDEEDSENEEEQEKEIQFNDTESEDDEGAEGHDNNRVNLDEFDES